MKPKLRFPGYEEEWEEKKLGEIAEYSKQKNKNKNYKETFTNSAEYGIISQSDFFDRSISNNKNIDGYYIVHPDDFVYNPRISNLAPYGPIRKNNLGRIGIMSPLYLVFKVINQNKNFLSYYFMTNHWNRYIYSIGDVGVRADRVSIKKDDFFDMPISLPSLHEQEKIGEFFSLLDQRIEKQEEKIELMKERKKGWMQKVFHQEIRFKDENGNDYPDWEEKKLKDVAKKIQRGASPRPISDKKWFDDNSPIGWIRISDITRSGKYIYDVEQKLSTEGIAKSRFLESDNLILSIAATIGKPVINKIPVCIHDGFIVFKDIYEFNNIEFLYYYLLYIQPQWFKYQQPGSQANLNSDLVRNQDINLPSLPEQEKIANFLSIQDELIEKEEEKLNLLKEQKKGLLQQMFV